MAKLSKNTKIFQGYDIRRKIVPWIENKTTAIRKFREPMAARASRWGAPAGVALVILILLTSLLLPKDAFQQAKNRLLRNPNDFQAQISLAEKFLANNQFEEAEKILLLAQGQINRSDKQILGEQTSQKFEELWQKKQYSDPKDIKRLITAWEKIVEEKPGYRDGYLQLAYLHYKLYENEKAKEYLEKAIELDPNYEPTREMEKFLQ